MHLFISPHPDDAVFSCGGRIYQLVQSGHTVQIWTIMASDPPVPLPNSALIQELHARWRAGEHPIKTRRQEDQHAAQILGATITFGTLTDCVYRTHANRALYPYGDNDLFGPPHPDDPAHIAMDMLALPEGQLDTLYVPLAIGDHVDHTIIRNWALRQGTSSYRLVFYEDFPYARAREAVEATISTFPGKLYSVLHPLEESDITAKLKAMQAHTSQISTFWPDLDTMAQDTRQHLAQAGNGTPAERYWLLDTTLN